MSLVEHTCHAISCTSVCKPEMLFCRHHWSMVPGLMQPVVYAYYRRGQCDDKNPSTQWLVAAMAAVIYVALQERVRKNITRAKFHAGIKSWIMAISATFDE